MKTFKSIDSFLRHLATLPFAVEAAEKGALERGALIIEDEAKAEIGHYQDEAGPFPAWQPLSSATLDGFWAKGIGTVPGKVELGYSPPDNPLLRTGSLRDSIEHTVIGNEAVIGSNNEVAVWQEMGTPDARFPIPPRSFLGGAAVRKGEEAAEAMSKDIVRALCALPRLN